jgi:predicted nuclease of predicted toxin-antitoxin system
MPRSILLDMGISPKVLNMLRARGWAVYHIRDLGMATASDVEILAEARRQDAAVITSDKDLAEHVVRVGRHRSFGDHPQAQQSDCRRAGRGG